MQVRAALRRALNCAMPTLKSKSTAETLNRHMPVPGRLMSVLSTTIQIEELGPQCVLRAVWLQGVSGALPSLSLFNCMAYS